MKPYLKLISLMLVSIMLLSALASCSPSFNLIEDNENNDGENKDGEQQEGNQDGDAEQTANDPENPDVLTIFKNSAYTVKVVIPENATTAESSVYANLRSELEDKISVAAPYITDRLNEGESRDPNEYAILVGNTNYEESKQAYEGLTYGNSSLQVVNNKIVLAFTTRDEGMTLIHRLARAIETDSNKSFWIARSLSFTNKSVTLPSDMPEYPSSQLSLVDCDDDTTMIVAGRTTLDEFNLYCNALVEQSGYTSYSSRDNVNGNYFRTYTKDSTAVTAYFMAYSKTARIISGPISHIPTKDADTTPERYEPELTIVSQSEWMNNGLGMIYLLPNGKFLIIDGGYDRRDNFYKLLKNLAPDEDEIVIAAWYISHPHGDHHQALMNLLKNHSKDVKIESILFNFTLPERYDAITTGSDGSGASKNFRNTLARYLGKDTKIIKPHTGQIYEYGSAQVEVLFTVEDVLPGELDYLNTTSLVTRIKIGEHSMMALADTTHVTSKALENNFGSYLQSEMVQLAHHGTYPGYASLYTKINAKVLIWPSNYSNAESQITNSAVAAAVKYATDVYVANKTNITLKIPYTCVNNKQDFLADINQS
jgi:hypothetical protein